MTAVEARLLLSDKESWALALKNQGRKRAEIAAEMGVSRSRVDDLLYQAKQKLGINYQNHELFSPRVYLAPEQALKNVNITDRDKQLGEIKYGKARMAYSRHMRNNPPDTSEYRLTGAINGIGPQGYLFKKRCEARATLTMSARYHLVKLTSPVGQAVSREIEWNRLSTVKTDFDEAEDGARITTYSVLCKSIADYENLMRAVRSTRP